MLCIFKYICIIYVGIHHPWHEIEHFPKPEIPDVRHTIPSVLLFPTTYCHFLRTVMVQRCYPAFKLTVSLTEFCESLKTQDS